MPVGIYVDVHIPKVIVTGLRLRAVDVLTAQDDGMDEAEDSQLLDRAAELGRIIFTHDADFLKEANRRSRAGEDFVGIVYAHQLNAPTGRCIDDLELIAKTCDATDLLGKVEFIPY